jgi:hypothetical protein
MKSPDKKNAKYGEASQYITLITKVGSIMVIFILSFFLIGVFIESKIDLHGFVIIGFTILGVIGGFWFMFSSILNMLSKDNEK